MESGLGRLHQLSHAPHAGLNVIAKQRLSRSVLKNILPSSAVSGCPYPMLEKSRDGLVIW